MDSSQTSKKSVISLFKTHFVKFHTWSMDDEDCLCPSHGSVKSTYIVYSVKDGFFSSGLVNTSKQFSPSWQTGFKGLSVVTASIFTCFSGEMWYSTFWLPSDSLMLFSPTLCCATSCCFSRSCWVQLSISRSCSYYSSLANTSWD